MHVGEMDIAFGNTLSMPELIQIKTLNELAGFGDFN